MKDIPEALMNLCDNFYTLTKTKLSGTSAIPVGYEDIGTPIIVEGKDGGPHLVMHPSCMNTSEIQDAYNTDEGIVILTTTSEYLLVEDKPSCHTCSCKKRCS